MAVKSEAKVKTISQMFENIRPGTIPGSGDELQQLMIEQMADRHFAYNKSVMQAAIESIKAKLVVDREARIANFGSFTVAILPKDYRVMNGQYRTAVVFNPHENLLKELEYTNAKF